MNILLQMTLSILLVFGLGRHTFTLQEPLYNKATSKKSWWKSPIFSQREVDTNSDSSQESSGNSDFLSEDNSSTRHSSHSDEQVESTLNQINIPDTNTTSQEFKQLHYQIYPEKPSYMYCLFACCQKSKKI